MKLKNIIKLTTLSASVGLFVSCKDTASTDKPAEPTDAAAPTEQKSVPLTKLTPAKQSEASTNQAESAAVYQVMVSGAG